VPYKGSTAALSGLISGTVDAMFIVSPAVIPLLEDKRVQALAITTRERTQFMAGVPTLVESGFPSFQAESWIGILAPAKTPDPVIGKLETEIRKIMQSPAAQDAIKAIQANQMTGTAQEFGVFLTQERTKWGDIIKEANIVIE
jgi:tripartite-type tricarboxylate transporter receptor subunit TctC